MSTHRPAFAAALSLLALAPAAWADIHVVDFFPEEGTNGNTIQLRFLGPSTGTVTNTRLVIDFTTQNNFDAADLTILLVVPVTAAEPGGGFWFITGEDLGWSGQVTFHADISTNMINGSLNPGLWGFDVGSVNDPPAYAGSFSAQTRFELTIVPAPAGAMLAAVAGAAVMRRRR